jgi:hypothetical protein
MRIPGIACAITAAALLAGCAATYQNPNTCEQMMRSGWTDSSQQDKLTITHTGTAIHGTRVVVEGSSEHTVTTPAAASGAIPASAPPPASGAAAGKAADPASASGAIAGFGSAPTSGASGASATPIDANAAVTAAGADAASVATVSTGSATAAKPKQPAKPVKITEPAAVECTFNQTGLSAFRWLAPPELVKTPSDAE